MKRRPRYISLRSALAHEQTLQWERFVARGGHPVLLLDMIRRSNVGHIRRVLGLPNIRYWKRYAETSFFEARELARVRGAIRRRLRTRPETLHRNLEMLRVRLRQGVVWARRLVLTDPSRCSPIELHAAIERIFVWSDALLTSAYFPIIVDGVLKEELQRAGMTDEDVARYTAPTTYTLLQKKQNCLHRIRRRYGRNIPRVVLDRIQRTYAWSHSYVLHIRPYTRKQVRADIGRANRVIAPRRVLLPARWRRLKQWCAFGQALASFRDERLVLMTQLYFILHPFFCEAARRMDLSYDDIIQMTTEEIVNGRVSRRELAARKKGLGYLVLHGIPYIVTGNNLRTMERSDVVSATRVLHGTTAYPGQVEGRVRRVNPYTYDTIVKGDIIVTGMTTPEIAPFLSGVRAIITDEGGITAHAAIIAREHRIPCVLGTKDATRTLRTGDRVIVDADRGMVTKQ